MDVPDQVLFGQGGNYPLPLDPNSKASLSVALTEFGLNVILAVMLFAVFVAIFFFTIASQLEKRSVENNTSRVIKDLMSTMHDTLTEEQRTQIGVTLNTNLTTPDLSNEDAEVARSNSRLMNHTLTVLGTIFGCGVAFVLLVWGAMKYRAGSKGIAGIHYPNLKHIILENMILLGFVAATEFLFLFCIGMHYQSLDGNRIRRGMLNTMQDFVK